MDVQRLETFVAVAESESLAEAAKRLGYARSTVTSHLQSLERSLGAALLERRATGHRLTHAGVCLLEYAKDILEKMAQAQTAVTAAAENGSHTTLSIGATASLCTYRLPGFLRTLGRLVPDIETQVFVGEVAELRAQVSRGELSAALVNSRTASVQPARTSAPEQDNRRHLWIDRAVLIGAPEAVARPSRLLLTAPGCVFREIAEHEVLPRLGRVDIQQVGSVDGVKSSALAGLGLGLVPLIAVGPQLENRQLVEIPLPLPSVTTELIWNAEVTPAYVVQHLRRLGPQQTRSQSSGSPLPGVPAEAATGRPHDEPPHACAARPRPA
ncbi:LysR family transcriptional regulator [Streptomyces sp. NPDC001135]